MMPRKPILLTPILALLAVMLLGCGTTRQAIQAPAEPTLKVEKEEIALTLRYIDDAALKEDFGTGANPFLTQYYRMSFRRILVFELTLKNQSGVPVELEATRCDLDYGAKEIEATNRFQLGNYWETLDDDPRIIDKKKKLIERWMLPNRATVGDGSSLFGYLVFKGNLPRQGEATVRVPVFRQGGSLSFDFRYTF
jgi:hypothetical protein